MGLKQITYSSYIIISVFFKKTKILKLSLQESLVILCGIYWLTWLTRETYQLSFLSSLPKVSRNPKRDSLVSHVCTSVRSAKLKLNVKQRTYNLLLIQRRNVGLNLLTINKNQMSGSLIQSDLTSVSAVSAPVIGVWRKTGQVQVTDCPLRVVIIHQEFISPKLSELFSIRNNLILTGKKNL